MVCTLKVIGIVVRMTYQKFSLERVHSSRRKGLGILSTRFCHFGILINRFYVHALIYLLLSKGANKMTGSTRSHWFCTHSCRGQKRVLRFPRPFLRVLVMQYTQCCGWKGLACETTFTCVSLVDGYESSVPWIMQEKAPCKCKCQRQNVHAQQHLGVTFL